MGRTFYILLLFLKSIANEEFAEIYFCTNTKMESITKIFNTTNENMETAPDDDSSSKQSDIESPELILSPIEQENPPANGEPPVKDQWSTTKKCLVHGLVVVTILGLGAACLWMLGFISDLERDCENYEAEIFDLYEELDYTEDEVIELMHQCEDLEYQVDDHAAFSSSAISGLIDAKYETAAAHIAAFGTMLGASELAFELAQKSRTTVDELDLNYLFQSDRYEYAGEDLTDIIRFVDDKTTMCGQKFETKELCFWDLHTETLVSKLATLEELRSLDVTYVVKTIPCLGSKTCCKWYTTVGQKSDTDKAVKYGCGFYGGIVGAVVSGCVAGTLSTRSQVGFGLALTFFILFLIVMAIFEMLCIHYSLKACLCRQRCRNCCCKFRPRRQA